MSFLLCNMMNQFDFLPESYKTSIIDTKEMGENSFVNEFPFLVRASCDSVYKDRTLPPKPNDPKTLIYRAFYTLLILD